MSKKIVLWNLARADQQLSLHIRKRDGRCMKPKCPYGFGYEADIRYLECSHWEGRGTLVSRFDPDNCVAACHWCHVAWEKDKDGDYKIFMRRFLGLKRMRALEKRISEFKYKNIPYLTWAGAIRSCKEYLTNGKS